MSSERYVEILFCLVCIYTKIQIGWILNKDGYKIGGKENETLCRNVKIKSFLISHTLLKDHLYMNGYFDILQFTINIRFFTLLIARQN